MSLSIVVCTYNPSDVVFNRLVSALINLDKSNLEYEVILIDNNSIVPLTSRKYIRNLLHSDLNVLLHVETKPGLTAARIAGIKRSKFEWIIFFDDDNEPQFDYLIRVNDTVCKHHNVAAWGPGTVKVNFLHDVDCWIENKRHYFQETNCDKTEFRCVKPLWQDCYPYGTGLIIRKDVALEYVKRVELGRYTLTDRNGRSLSSGGDLQLVLTAIELGHSAGKIANLKLNHNIAKEKTSISYLMRMTYGTNSAYIKALNQVFIDNQILSREIGNYEIFLTIYSLFRIHWCRLNWRDFFLLISSKMGEVNSRFTAIGNRKPLLLFLFEKIIKY
jgi:glycosyltransferase involved in cell wall biosynthesis